MLIFQLKKYKLKFKNNKINKSSTINNKKCKKKPNFDYKFYNT